MLVYIIFKLLKNGFINEENIKKFFKSLPDLLIIFIIIVVIYTISEYLTREYKVEKFKGEKI